MDKLAYYVTTRQPINHKITIIDVMYVLRDYLPLVWY